MKKTILFLCTGNYYRSRFAEMLFNALAAQQGLAWQADSRGLAVELGSGNVGPMSVQAIAMLQNQGVALPAEQRYPMQVTEGDLEAADAVIAVYDLEHRPLVQRKFPAWLERVTYWGVPDLDKATAQQALGLIEQHVRALVGALAEKEKLAVESAG